MRQREVELREQLAEARAEVMKCHAQETNRLRAEACNLCSNARGTGVSAVAAAAALAASEKRQASAAADAKKARAAAADAKTEAEKLAAVVRTTEEARDAARVRVPLQQQSVTTPPTRWTCCGESWRARWRRLPSCRGLCLRGAQPTSGRCCRATRRDLPLDVSGQA
eukprot:2132388-Pleurochrysis_carterae.AAC.2